LRSFDKSKADDSDGVVNNWLKQAGQAADFSRQDRPNASRRAERGAL